MDPQPPDPKLHPIAQAYRWFSIAITAVLMMLLPAAAGGWLDNRLGTHWMTLGGLAVGMILGIYYLLAALPKPPRPSRPGAKPDPDDLP